MICPTPDDLLCDSLGRPYFIWDEDITLDEFEHRLADPEVSDHWLATLLRQAKPDDVYRFIDIAEIARRWQSVRAGTGRMQGFWDWRTERWRTHGD